MRISDVLGADGIATVYDQRNGNVSFAKITYLPRRMPDRVVGWYCIVPVVFCTTFHPQEDLNGKELFYGTAAIVNLATGEETLVRTIEDLGPASSLEEARRDALDTASFVEKQVELAPIAEEVEMMTEDGLKRFKSIKLDADVTSNPMSFFVLR